MQLQMWRISHVFTLFAPQKRCKVLMPQLLHPRPYVNVTETVIYFGLVSEVWSADPERASLGRFRRMGSVRHCQHPAEHDREAKCHLQHQQQ